MNSINVFSFDDIEGEHIVGPIVAQNSAYYKRATPVSTEKSNEKLIFADYSRETPSYVGNITTRLDGGRALAANYDYDRGYDAAFAPPLFYTSTSTELINKGNENWLKEYVHIVGSEIPAFQSPNNSGETPINHNDDYVDFEVYQKNIQEECERLLEDGSIEGFPMVKKTYDSRVDGPVLQVKPGESWTVINADELIQIDIQLPEGSDYFTSSSPDPLTVNFVCETINPDIMDNKTVSQFPEVTMNGKQFVSDHGGETIEYNEFGNKLIFNMPYIKTDADGNNRVVTYGEGQNTPGHLLMPQAEFWNYHEDAHGALVWEGGNINGLLLAKDVHVGRLEMHMWAYGGKEAQYADCRVEGIKTVNGIQPQGETFEFELSPVEAYPEGLYTTGFPLKAESDKDGKFQFQYLVFLKAGTYKFHVNEVIPASSGSMIYDQSKYEVTVVVTQDAEGAFTTTMTMQKTVDNEGNRLADAVDVEQIMFDNVDSSPVFPATGGVGSMIYYLVGLFFVFVSLLGYKRMSVKN